MAAAASMLQLGAAGPSLLRRPTAARGAAGSRLAVRRLQTRAAVAPVAQRRGVLQVRSAAAAEAPTTSSPDEGEASTSKDEDVDPVKAAVIEPISYSKQYDEIYSKPLQTRVAVAKPDINAQAKEEGATKVLGSDVHAVGKRNLFFNRKWDSTDKGYLAFIAGVHIVALFAPFTFSMQNLALFAIGYFITGCLGITLSYHRQLSHRSFQTPKWLEYILAYCGVLAVQGDPIEWVSSHRYHHLHTDTPLDPHSPYEGFWWSHAGWLLDHEAVEERVSDRSNATDMSKQPFYQFLEKTYIWHIVASYVALYAFGGFGALVWGGALRTVWVYHITWLVNSAAHVWGNQQYKTGDLSRNNWWVGILAFGEGWHNNHHAFEFSARHGLSWWQFDMTWMVISTLKFFGLANKVKLPSEAQKARLAFD